MDIYKAKDLLPIIKAHAEGKTIQYYSRTAFNSTWKDCESEDIDFEDEDYEYRIKPEPSYRPFANAEECWQEMLKHHPFGYIYFASEKLYHNIIMLAPEQGAHEAYIRIGNFTVRGLEEAFRVCTFADGTPFGIKEEKQL